MEHVITTRVLEVAMVTIIVTTTEISMTTVIQITLTEVHLGAHTMVITTEGVARPTILIATTI